MARNKYPGHCYACAKHVEKGQGHFEKSIQSGVSPKWRVKCLECAIKNKNKNILEADQ